MESNLRKTLKLRVKQPDMKTLRNLSSQLKSNQQQTFAHKYGRLLNLLEVDVREGALTALAQYYDPPLRCFTFQDFQLAPTLEEFNQILGYSLGNKRPYLYMGHYPSLSTVATSLKINVRELASEKKTKRGVEGFSMGYLEKFAQHLVANERWDDFMDVLALIIYGIVLFPNIDDFIDFAAIDVFLAYKHERKSPVPTILADTYHTLSLRHEKKGGVILCCLPTLYIWFITYMIKGGGRVEVKDKSEWAHSIANLSEKTIFWHSREREIDEMICHCGDFPNVPLMGTRGCINYNPILALRQFGYPIRGAPTEESITPFIVYELDQNLEMLNRIRRAWDQVTKKGKELGVSSCVTKESYNQWLKERVQKVKLSFRTSVSVVEDAPMQTPISLEEIEKLKEALVKSEEEKKILKKELTEAHRKCITTQRETAQKTQSIEAANKRARIEEECKLRTQGCLEAASKELGLRRQERDEARVDAERWKEAWKESKIVERSIQRQLENLKQQLNAVVAEYEGRVQNEKQLSANLVSECQAMLIEKNKGIDELEGQIEQLNREVEGYKENQKRWAHNFVNRALQIKEMLSDASYLLQKAEGMTNPLSTTEEIYEFLEYCKNMISQMRGMANRDK